MADAKGNPLGTRYVERFLRNLFNPQGPADYGVNLSGNVQPSVDVRPFHPWDYRDFGIIPWTGRYFVGATAAQFSYIQCAALGPGGYDLVIVEFRPELATYLFLHTTTNTGVLTSQGVEITDSGVGPWGSYNVNLADISTSATTGGALQGTVSAFLGASGSTICPVILRSGVSAIFATITPNVVNTALTISMRGFLVPSTVGSL